MSQHHANQTTEHPPQHQQTHLQTLPLNPVQQQVAKKPTNWLSTIGFILAIVGWLLPATILSGLGYRKSKTTGSGRGLAIAAQVIVGCWLLLIVLAVTWAIIDEARPHPTRTVSSPTGTYSIQIDDNLSKMSRKDASADDLAYENLFDEKYILTTTVSRLDYAEDVTTTDYGVDLAQRLGDQLQNSKVEYRALYFKPANPRDYDVFDARVSGTIKKVNIIYYIRIIGDKDNFYALKAWTIPSKEPRIRPELFKIMESFELTSKK